MLNRRRLSRRTQRCSALLALLAAAAGCAAQPDPFEDPPTACAGSPDFVGSPTALLSGPTTIAKPFEISPWATGRGMALDGKRLLVVDEANGTLVALDSDTLAIANQWQVGSRPWQVVATPNHAWVTLRGGHAVAKVDLASGGVQQFEVGAAPVALALSADQKQLFVAVGGARQLVRMNAASGAVLAQAPTDPSPQAVVVLSPTEVMVVHQSGPARLFTANGDNKLLPSKADLPLAVDSLLHVKGDNASAGAIATRAVAVALNPGTGDAVVAHVLVRPGSVQGLLQVSAQPPHDCNSGNGQGNGMAMPASAMGDSGGEFSGGGGDLGGGYGGGGGGSPAAPTARPVEPVLTEVFRSPSSGSLVTKPWRPMLDEAEGLLSHAGRATGARLDQPSDIAFHPSLRLAVLVGRGTDNLVVVNTANKMAYGIAQLPEGSAPRSVVLSADGNRAYVLLSHQFRVAEVDLKTFLTDSPQGSRLAKPSRFSKAYGADPLAPAARLGRQVFFSSENSRLSQHGRFACATCHLDGGDDQQVWFIADGPRQTPVLAGRLQGTGPFNWKGTHTQLKSNMQDTVQRMLGSGLTDAELTSLEQFLLTLPAPPNPNVAASGALTVAQERGKAVFYSAKAACGSCHLGGTGTDGKLYDVGIATKGEDLLQMSRSLGQDWRRFNTPSLAGLYGSAPYFHNGSAATLEDVLAMTSDLGLMGDTSDLTPEQRQDLMAYLLTL